MSNPRADRGRGLPHALRPLLALVMATAVLTACNPVGSSGSGGSPGPGAAASPTAQSGATAAGGGSTTAAPSAGESAQPSPGADEERDKVRKEAESSPDAALLTNGLHTWGHERVSQKTDSGVADDEVRESPYYSVRVAPAGAPDDQRDSFTYLSIPRNGEGKRGYSGDDGADFAANEGVSMSWSSFEYSTDVLVDVTLKDGRTISSADDVTIRPQNEVLSKTLVDEHTIRIAVPASTSGHRLTVDFAPELMDVYANRETGLTTQSEGNDYIETEPRNSMVIFAQPPAPASSVPTQADGAIEKVDPGEVRGLDSTSAEILYFGPGTYWMGADYSATLPSNVKWVYLAPGAFVKGAFTFADSGSTDYRVTGYGVLSGEQYGYETDRANGYAHKTAGDCHATCVKMLQFSSNDAQQRLRLHGVTVKEPPYHSFVVYGNEDTFSMDVSNYQQVGGWYWQTDGLELYTGSTMRHTFFHANDDVLKLYHSNVSVEDTVVWKNENGPVFQWGWVPRDVDGVTVDGTKVVHNRMYSGTVGVNSCVFNSSRHWDAGSGNTADPSKTVKNMRLTNTAVEGAVNCGIRIYALSNIENLEIDGFHVDRWGDQPADLQKSLLTRESSPDGRKVSLGNETSEGRGLKLSNYTVGGQVIRKSDDDWRADRAGRLAFDAENWEGWNADQ